MKLFGKLGQPRCRGTPQLFQITKGLLAWPFGPFNSCPTYRKCWFGVLTCGRADLKSMRALIHPRVVNRFKEIAKISDPAIRALLDPRLNATSTTKQSTNYMKFDHQKNYSANVPLMTRWSIRALRLAMRVINPTFTHHPSFVTTALTLIHIIHIIHFIYYSYQIIGTELVIPEQRLVTLQNVSRSVDGWSWQNVNTTVEGLNATVEGGGKNSGVDVNNSDNNTSQTVDVYPLKSSRSLLEQHLYVSNGGGKGVGINRDAGANTTTSVNASHNQEQSQQQPRPSTTTQQQQPRSSVTANTSVHDAHQRPQPQPPPQQYPRLSNDPYTAAVRDAQRRRPQPQPQPPPQQHPWLSSDPSTAAVRDAHQRRPQPPPQHQPWLSNDPYTAAVHDAHQRRPQPPPQQQPRPFVSANMSVHDAQQRRVQPPPQQHPRPFRSKKQPKPRIFMGLVNTLPPLTHDDVLFDASDDVIIAQYTLTHPSTDNRLEIRQEELRLSSLLDWDAPHRDVLGMDMMLEGSIYLGGTETRCRFFTDTGCRLPQKMKSCIVQSYVTGTPIVVDVPDGSTTHCPAVERRRQGLEPQLPLCKAGTGSNPGRWIQASAHSLRPNRCDPNVDNYYPWPHKYTKIRDNMSTTEKRKFHNILSNTNTSNFNTNNISTSANANNTTISASTNATNDKHHLGKTVQWTEASGDPCFIRSKYKNKNLDKKKDKDKDKHVNMEEELRAAHWFYAPYQCRYHFYTPNEAVQCFQHKRIHNVLMIGDSINRDLFHWLTEFFKGSQHANSTTSASTGYFSSNFSNPLSEVSDNVQQARNKLKYATNVLKTKEIHVDGENTALPSFNFILIKNNEMHGLMDDLGIFNVKHGSAGRPIDLLITNHAIAHKGPSDWPEFVHHWQSNEELFWQLFHNGTYVRKEVNGSTSGIPRHRIFQGPMAYFGATRFFSNSDESFLRASKLLRSSLESLGFSVLSDYLLTDGKYLPNEDGLHFFGTGRQMEVNVLMNLLCNDLLE